MKKLLSLLASSLLFVTAQAQYNDSTHYYASYASTGSINKTDGSDAYLLNNSLKLGLRQKDLSMNFNGSWVYGQQDNSPTNNDFTSTLDFDLYKTLPHFYYWGLATYTSSLSLKIINQYQTGLGVAYKIIDKKNFTLNISDGLLYEKDDLYLRDTIRDVYNTWRNSLRIMIKGNLKDLVTLSSSTFFQNSLAHSNDYIINSTNSLSVKLYKWLNLTLAFNYNKFNRTQKENLLFTYGLTVERYF